MDSSLAVFTDIAPYLTHPLVLVGFVLLLFFGLHRTLLKTGILPPLTTRTGGRVVHIILRYGFAIALSVIVCGFGLAAYKTYRETRLAISLEHDLGALKDLIKSVEKDVSLLHDSMERSRMHIDTLASTDESDERRHTIERKLLDTKATFDSLMRLVKNDINKAQMYIHGIKSQSAHLQGGRLDRHDIEIILQAEKLELEEQYEMAQQFGEKFNNMTDNSIKRFKISI